MNTHTHIQNHTPFSDAQTDKAACLARPEHLLTLEDRRSAEEAWQALLATGTARRHHFALQALLRDRDPSKGFTPIRNPNKLANGQRAHQAYEQALCYLLYNGKALLKKACPVLSSQPDLFDHRLAALIGRIENALARLKLEGERA